MVNCAVLNCPYKSETHNFKEHGISFHRFPAGICDWIEATGRTDWVPSATSLICSIHFENICFEPSILRRRLYSWAVPTLNLHNSKNESNKFEKPGEQPEPAETSDTETKKLQQSSALAGAATLPNPIDLDRFKRRLIRTVARLREEDGPDLWAAVEKAMGKDCTLMWKRMRLVTLKKMARLLMVGDIPSRLSAPTRMTITDWLLVDLVLVHEDINSMTTNLSDPEPEPLRRLFQLVQEFDLEKAGIAERWANAAMQYNQRGKQCSPMLLQRRWFELKFLTRQRFYSYWDTHRRDPNTSRPSQLNVEIAQRYPHIVTCVLPSWYEMKKSGWVVLPDEFERIHRLNEKSNTSNSEEMDDLVLIEPVIETIDVDLETELEDAVSKNNAENTAEDADNSRIDSPTDSAECEDDDVDIQTNDLEGNTVPLKKDTASQVSFEIDIIVKEQNNEHLENVKMEMLDIQDEVIDIVKEDSETLPQGEIDNSVNQSTDHADPVITDETGGENVVKLPVILKIESVAENYPMDVFKPIIQDDDPPRPNTENCFEKFMPETPQAQPKLNYTESEKPGPKSKKHWINTERISPDLMNACMTSPVNRPGPKCSKSSLYIEVENGLFSKALIRDSISTVPDPFHDVTKPSTGPLVFETSMTSNAVSFQLDQQRPLTSEEIPVVVDSSEPSITKIYPNAFELSPSKDTPFLLDPSEPSTSKHGPLNLKPSTSKEVPFLLDPSEPSTSKHDPFNLTPLISREAPTGSELLSLSSTKEEPEDELLDCEIDFVDDDNEEVFHIDEETLKCIRQQHINSVLKEEDQGDSTRSPAISISSSPVQEKDENSCDSIDAQVSPKFDLKLLMLPVVYTKKLDDMGLFETKKDIRCTVFNSVISHELIEMQSKPKSNKGADLNILEGMDQNHAENEAYNYAEECLNDNDNYAEVSIENNSHNENLTEPQLIKETSYLFQKPKSRSYTPINLCKNPDFNTRLRRLSVAFLMKARNRQLIKACKPLTVDVHKMFEQKLFGGILLIKPTDKSLKENLTSSDTVINEIETKSATVLPSAMPAQSLFDKETVDINNLTEPEQRPIRTEDHNVLFKARQNKSIQLPDIEKIRQINSQLLTAQVPPLQVNKEIILEEKLNDFPEQMELVRKARVFEVCRGSDGGAYKKSFSQQTVEKPQLTEPKAGPKRKVAPSINHWYCRSNKLVKKDTYLLKHDALQRMLKALNPLEAPYKHPVRKIKYCCTAKRHQVLNEARSRLLINTKGELRRRRFQKELIIHKCLPQMCKCCCKFLVNLPEPPSSDPKITEPSQPEPIPESPKDQQPIDPDSEIVSALAGLEPIPITNPVEFDQPAVGLAPSVVTPQKEVQNETPTKSHNPNEYSEETYSPVSPTYHCDATKSKNFECNTVEPSNTEHCTDIIELDDSSDQEHLNNDSEIKTCHCQSHNPDHKLDKDAVESVEDQKKNENALPEDSNVLVFEDTPSVATFDYIDLSKDTNKIISESLALKQKIKRKRRQKNPRVTASDNRFTHLAKKFLKKKDSQYREWENVKKASKTAFGFDARNLPKRGRTPRRIVLPELIPIQSNRPDKLTMVEPSICTETNDQFNAIENASLNFSPGTKITLLSNGLVSATSIDGKPLALTGSQYVALQMFVANLQGQSVIPMQNSNAIYIDNDNVEHPTDIPCLEIIEGDQIKSKSHEENVLITTTNDANSNTDKPTNDARDEFPQTLQTQSSDLEVTDASLMNVNKNAVPNREVLKIKKPKNAESAGAFPTASENVDKNEGNCKVKTSDTEVIDKSDTDVTNNASLVLEIPDSQETENETKDVPNINKTTSNAFLTVRNFAKLPVATSQSNSQITDMFSTARNTILSDLMEISGISSEDTTLPGPLSVSELDNPVSVYQEWTIGGNPNANESTTVTNRSVMINNGSAGQFYVYNSETAQVVPVTLIQKSPIKVKPPREKIVRITQRRKSRFNVDGVVEVKDSDSENETSVQTAANQLLKLLRKKKKDKLAEGGKLKRVYIVKKLSKNVSENLPEMLKRYAGLKTYKRSNIKRRKQQIEAKIDLVDSDAPMEEEYLLDSQGSDSERPKHGSPHLGSRRRKQVLTSGAIALDSDNSDDEPLSKVAAKKARRNVDSEKQVNTDLTASAHSKNVDHAMDKQSDQQQLRPTVSVFHEYPRSEDANTPSDKTTQEIHSSSVERASEPENTNSVPQSVNITSISEVLNDCDSKHGSSKSSVCGPDDRSNDIQADDHAISAISETDYLGNSANDETDSQGDDCILGM